MGVLDKIKNALFEVEYVEVDEPPKKEKKVKTKEKRVKEVKEKEDKPIAKKVVLPGKREDKVEAIYEEELKDEDFEIRPKDESVKEKPREEFKFMDDNDFKVDEEPVVQPEILHVFEENEPMPATLDNPPVNTNVVNTNVSTSYEPPVEENYQQDAYKPAYPIHEANKLYGVDNSYNVPVQPYGTYEKKEEKTYFKPSPIISPIYGILDKNYKKEDVKEKKDVRISGYSRSNVSVDDIRNKAYGEEKKQSFDHEVDNKVEVEEEDDNLLVDLSDRAKPEVKELTVGDAVEYFQDLGLEYNVDYVDVSKEKENTKRIKVEEKEILPSNPIPESVDTVKEDKQIEKLEGKHSVQVEDETPIDKKIESDNDNLFDLIDSMYQEHN